jgi:hypothetical protein
MVKRFALLMVLLPACLALADMGQKESDAPSTSELDAVTARGRMLEEYDVAAWYATDAVDALKPDKATAPAYIARKTKAGWEVVFGRLNEGRDQFLISYRAIQGANPQDFVAKKVDPVSADRGFYLSAAKALDTAGRDFGRQTRPYNTYILPASGSQLYVYFLPGQTVQGVYPLGADVRYTISADGGTVVEKRQMHKALIENKSSPKPGETVAAGYHNHVANNLPEDSDVFHVLNRKPLMPEYVAGPDKHVYQIETDGTIKSVR